MQPLPVTITQEAPVISKSVHVGFPFPRLEFKDLAKSSPQLTDSGIKGVTKL
jgi:hypothetical protein